jgi:hypothetical protein
MLSSCIPDEDVYAYKYDSERGCRYSQKIKVGEDSLDSEKACPLKVVCSISVDRTLIIEETPCYDSRKTDKKFRECTENERDSYRNICVD